MVSTVAGFVETRFRGEKKKLKWKFNPTNQRRFRRCPLLPLMVGGWLHSCFFCKAVAYLFYFFFLSLSFRLVFPAPNKWGVLVLIFCQKLLLLLQYNKRCTRCHGRDFWLLVFYSLLSLRMNLADVQEILPLLTSHFFFFSVLTFYNFFQLNFTSIYFEQTSSLFSFFLLRFTLLACCLHFHRNNFPIFSPFSFLLIFFFYSNDDCVCTGQTDFREIERYTRIHSFLIYIYW